MSELEVLIEGDRVARIHMNKAGRLSLDYEPGWHHQARHSWLRWTC